jgi:hypothetical protein
MSGVTRMRIGVALAFGLVACGAAAAELPRVFFTPAERAAISAQRFAGRPFAAEPGPAVAAGAAAPTAADATPAGAAAPVPALRARRIDGVTVGRDAKPVAWIGGERIPDGSSWGAYRVRVERDGVRLVATDGSVRRLRVGMELPP